VGQDQQLSALEHEIEQTRQNLAATIDQLLYRVHPKTIATREVNSIKAHFVDSPTGQPRTDNILKTAGVVVAVVGFFVVVRKVVR
jgi:hypothetical protein